MFTISSLGRRLRASIVALSAVLLVASLSACSPQPDHELEVMIGGESYTQQMGGDSSESYAWYVPRFESPNYTYEADVVLKNTGKYPIFFDVQLYPIDEDFSMESGVSASLDGVDVTELDEDGFRLYRAHNINLDPGEERVITGAIKLDVEAIDTQYEGDAMTAKFVVADAIFIR